MEKFLNPSRREWMNNDGQTPKMLFTKEHQELKRREMDERYCQLLYHSSNIDCYGGVCCSLHNTGGTEPDTGVAIFWHKIPFILFAVSDTVSLFTAITSLLMFLSILTSRCTEEDFLCILPQRLCIGLLTLFISITFMMVAFRATLYLVFWKRVGWLLVPAALLAFLPGNVVRALTVPPTCRCHVLDKWPRHLRQEK